MDGRYSVNETGLSYIRCLSCCMALRKDAYVVTCGAKLCNLCYLRMKKYGKQLMNDKEDARGNSKDNEIAVGKALQCLVVGCSYCGSSLVLLMLLLNPCLIENRPESLREYDFRLRIARLYYPLSLTPEKPVSTNYMLFFLVIQTKIPLLYHYTLNC